MPTYEYLCKKCQLIFTVVQSLAEHGQDRVVCPHCQGRLVVQQFSTFFPRTSKKS